jgi:hypothetical protein
MATTVYPKQPDNNISIRATGAGDITLPETLTPGLYLVTSNSAQTWIANFKSNQGFVSAGTITSGIGYVSVPFEVHSINVPSGMSSYNFNVTIQKTNYALTPAPTFTSFVFTSTSGFFRVGTLTYSNAPAGATSIGYYDNLGNFFDVGSVAASPVASQLYGAVGDGSSGKTILVAKDAKGIWGQGSPIGLTSPISGSTTFSKSVTSTEVITVPTGVTSMSATLVGGGAGGGTAGYPWGGGGGGAGGYLASQTISTTPGTTITLSTGAGGGAASNGGNTQVSNIIAYGGGAGGSGGDGVAGGSGGGAGWSGSGYPPSGRGGVGTAGQGNRGAPANIVTLTGQYGGGGAGAAANTDAGGSGTYNNTFAITYSAGGKGNFASSNNPTASQPTTAGYGNGGDGAAGYTGSARSGISGSLIVSFTV